MDEGDHSGSNQVGSLLPLARATSGSPSAPHRSNTPSLLSTERIPTLLNPLLPPSCYLSEEATELLVSAVDQFVVVLVERLLERRRETAEYVLKRLPKIEGKDVFTALNSLREFEALRTRLLATPILHNSVDSTSVPSYGIGEKNPDPTIGLRQASRKLVGAFQINPHLLVETEETQKIAEKESKRDDNGSIPINPLLLSRERPLSENSRPKKKARKF